MPRDVSSVKTVVSVFENAEKMSLVDWIESQRQT